MRILITGASGFIGSWLVPFLTAHQHQVLPLHRGPTTETSEPVWEPIANRIDLAPAGKLDAVVHLAGENLAQRWTPDAKARIKSSREHGTRLLVEVSTCAAKHWGLATSCRHHENSGGDWIDFINAPATAGKE